MKKLLKIITVLVLGVSVLVLPEVVFAKTKKNTVNVGYGFGAGPNAVASLGLLEYERLLAKRFSVFARAHNLNWKFDDGKYEEGGGGTGIQGGARFYTMGKGLKGFFIDASIGYIPTSFDWKDDKGQSYETKGDGKTTSLVLGAGIGGKIPLGSVVYLQPGFFLGNNITLSDECNNTTTGRSCTNDESGIGFWAAAAFQVGFLF